MSISSAMQTGVSGLFANSTAVGKISENIANANTTGFKRGFSQMVTSTAGGGASDAGVRAVTGQQVSTGGSLVSTGLTTDLAISGDGFFVVSMSPNDPVQANYFLTRAGSFSPDENGNLVNAAGYYLAGYAYGEDGTLGAVDQTNFGQMATINVSDVELAAEATTAISLTGNLPAQETGLATPGAPFISSTSYYTALGANERIEFQWQPTGTDNVWTLTVADGAGTAFGSVDVTFSDSGATAGAPLLYGNVQNLATAPAAFAFDPATGEATLTLDNGTTPQTLAISVGAPGVYGGLTQFAGDFTPQEFTVDGSAVAGLSRTEIDERGDVWGVFDNGVRRALYNIPVATVTNPNGLIAQDGNAYQLSQQAGALAILTGGTGNAGSVVSGSLENSNVDIAQELTDLIRVQRAYSSNAKIITTADEMLAETTNLKR